MSFLQRSRQSIVFRSRRQLNKVKQWFSEEDRLQHMVGPPGVWKDNQEFQVEFLRAMGLSPSDYLLEIGCGPLRAGIVLIEYLGIGRYAGIDVRPAVIAEAERQISKHGLSAKKPEVLVSSSFGRDELGDLRFDMICAFHVLYHFDDPLVDECLAEVSRRLKPSGAAYANVNVHTPSGRWKQFPFLQRPVEFYQEAGCRCGLEVEVVGNLRDFGFPTTIPGHRDPMLRFTRVTA